MQTAASRPWCAENCVLSALQAPRRDTCFAAHRLLSDFVLRAENYRHQADVCHAYQVLTRGGLDRARIVVMMADDVAHATVNPHPGRLYNCPGCPDVYQGVRIDYRAGDVTADNVYAVLLGDAAAMRGVGSGRVVASGARDRVFVYYADHGAPGILGMPAPGPPIYGDALMATIAQKRLRRGFFEMVVFLEACESGSIFEGLLGGDLGVFAVTAASASEPSWATYCPDRAQPASRLRDHVPAYF